MGVRGPDEGASHRSARPSPPPALMAAQRNQKSPLDVQAPLKGGLHLGFLRGLCGPNKTDVSATAPCLPPGDPLFETMARTSPCHLLAIMTLDKPLSFSELGLPPREIWRFHTTFQTAPKSQIKAEGKEGHTPPASAPGQAWCSEISVCVVVLFCFLTSTAISSATEERTRLGELKRELEAVFPILRS